MDTNRFSGAIGGMGKAPAIYSYVTNDGVADVTANGYWDELDGALSVGDIISAVLLEDGATTHRMLVVNLSTRVDSKTALLEVFIGDSRAEDEAGYQSDNFSGNIGAGSVSRMFTYRNNTDTVSDVLATGYFNELAPVLLVGDTIISVNFDGAFYLKVSDVTDGVVTVEEIVFV